jgi:CHRD domain
MHVLTASPPGRRLRVTAFVAALAVAALAAALAPSSASATVYKFTVNLSEANQAATGVPGDPGGKGKSKITMDTLTSTVCATTSWSGIDSAVGAGHVHAGAAGQPENPTTTIDLFPPDLVNGVSSPASGCTTVVPGQIELIAACPRDYNVVIHSFNHPVAAIRGQLGTTCSLPV